MPINELIAYSNVALMFMSLCFFLYVVIISHMEDKRHRERMDQMKDDHLRILEKLREDLK